MIVSIIIYIKIKHIYELKHNEIIEVYPKKINYYFVFKYVLLFCFISMLYSRKRMKKMLQINAPILSKDI